MRYIQRHTDCDTDEFVSECDYHFGYESLRIIAILDLPYFTSIHACKRRFAKHYCFLSS